MAWRPNNRVMNPILNIQDNFLCDFNNTRERVLAGVFDDVVSPVDAITYPAINKDLPQDVAHEMASGIAFFLGRQPEIRTIFSRAMHAGMHAPNKIHSDVIMGAYAAHIYLSTEWPDGAGTSFWSHKRFGMRHSPELDTTQIDSNDVSQWERYMLVQAKANRFLMHRGDAWHLAEPIGGWGDRPDNSRVVITAFFD